jgi:hypothetical protein
MSEYVVGDNMKISDATLDWLLEGEAWIAYRTRIDLLAQSEQDPQVISARNAMLTDEKMNNLLSELSDWPGTVISSHKSAGQSFHKLTFLSDVGLKAGDPGVDKIIEKIVDHQSVEGPFQLPVNVPVHFGGTGQEEWAWALCDAPLILYALAGFGLDNEDRVKGAARHLLGLVRDNGWPCAVSQELGKFRGPGRKDDPCPFANLAMLKALSRIAAYRDSEACHVGTESLLSLWSESAAQHPYMFYMGTDFRKLKVPFIWYDILHVLDVLSRFSWVRKDARFLDMLEIMKGSSNEHGRFTPASIWTAWKSWEFGQKKEPSRWLTLLVWRIIQRIEIT